MRDVFAAAARWLDDGTPFGLATLVGLREAAPAPLGTTIGVAGPDRIVGSIGAGCYESDIVESCLQTAADRRSRTIDVELGDEDAIFGANLCGGTMRVVTWVPDAGFVRDARAIADGDRDVRVRLQYRNGEARDAAFEWTVPRRRPLVLVGATALAAEIAALARRLDFHVTVVDPRPAFATSERLPNVDTIVQQWPDDCLPALLDAQTSVVILSHDEKFDVPALRCALDSPAAFVGLLGSRRTQAARRAALRIAGVRPTAFARIHGPVGLDIGAATVAETALSVLSEIVAARHARDGTPLTESDGSIHARPAERALP